MSSRSKVIVILALMVAQPVCAAGDFVEPNVFSEFIKEHEEIIKHFTSFIVAVIAVLGTIKVAKISRIAPDAAVKLEQMKFIDSLIIDKAWEEERGRFIVEEAFQLYYKTHIEVDVIVILIGLEKRFYAFSSYVKVGHLTHFNTSLNRIESLSTTGKLMHVLSLFCLSIVLLHVVVGAVITSYLLIDESISSVNIMLILVLALFSGLSLSIVFTWYSQALDVFGDFSRFERDLDGYVDNNMIRKTDCLLIFISVIVIGSIWAFIYFIYLQG